MNPADTSPLTFETFVNHADGRTEDGKLWWETCACRVKGTDEAEHECDYDATDDRYKGQMLKWSSDYDQQQCYVVQESELLDKDNWWLHLFIEITFYTKWYGMLRVIDAVNCLPLETQCSDVVRCDNS